jgi:predicted ATPase
LALELAATRVRSLGVHELLARLGDRFGPRATGHSDAPARQQTLWAVIDWNWKLVTEPERLVLRRLAVAADGWSLQAAEAICGTLHHRREPDQIRRGRLNFRSRALNASHDGWIRSEGGGRAHPHLDRAARTAHRHRGD